MMMMMTVLPDWHRLKSLRTLCPTRIPLSSL